MLQPFILQPWDVFALDDVDVIVVLDSELPIIVVRIPSKKD